MRRVVIDTSAYSAWKRGQAEARAELRIADELVLTAVILGELRFGFLRGARRTKNEEELAALLQSPRVRVVPIDEETSERYAMIRAGLARAGSPVAANDIWIAASAMQHGAIVLTADADFRKMAQIVVELLPPS